MNELETLLLELHGPDLINQLKEKYASESTILALINSANRVKSNTLWTDKEFCDWINKLIFATTLDGMREYMSPQEIFEIKKSKAEGARNRYLNNLPAAEEYALAIKNVKAKIAAKKAKDKRDMK